MLNKRANRAMDEFKELLIALRDGSEELLKGKGAQTLEEFELTRAQNVLILNFYELCFDLVNVIEEAENQ